MKEPTTPSDTKAPWAPLPWKKNRSRTPVELPEHESATTSPSPADNAPVATSLTPTSSPTRHVSVIARINGVLLPIVLLIAGYASVRHVDAANSDALGLVDVLPLSFYGIVILLGVSFVLRVRRKQLDQIALLAHVVVLIFLLHGIISWIEGFPRFAVSYTHMGLTEAIQRTHGTIPDLDARMNWPGFFTGSAVLSNIAGTSTIFPLLLWTPLVNNLLALPLFFALNRALNTDRRTTWLMVYFTFSVSWIGQDYYSPQATNYLFYLCIATVIFTYFRSDYAELPDIFRPVVTRIAAIIHRVSRGAEHTPGPSPVVRTTSLQRIGLISSLVLIYAASVTSHQLTPVFLLLLVISLVILRRTALRGFHTVMIVIFLGYLSFGAIGYWTGHMRELFGDAGNINRALKENVGSKVEHQTMHVWVNHGRMLLAGSVWLLAGFGLLRRLRAGKSDLIALLAMCVPVGVLFGQSYGGEGILRVFLFSLPFATTLGVWALLPTAKHPFTLQKALIAMGVIVLVVPLFFLARFGNEQFEYISRAEYQGYEKMYELTGDQSTYIGLAGNAPWKFRELELHRYVSFDEELLTFDFSPAATQEVVNKHLHEDPYLVFGRSMFQDISLQTGRDRHWGDHLVQQYLDTGEYVVLYQNPDFALLRNIHATADDLEEAS